MEHTALAVQTQRLRAESEALCLEWHHLVSMRGVTREARAEAWERYDAAWRAYLAAAQAEACEAAEAVAGRTGEDGCSQTSN